MGVIGFGSLRSSRLALARGLLALRLAVLGVTTAWDKLVPYF